MTNNPDNQTNGAHDPEISAQYQALAKDTTPTDLDRIVLREAAKAVKSGGSAGRSAAWYRPVTFVATLGLSLALLLELSEIPLFDPPSESGIQTDEPADANIFQDAVDSAATSVREVGAAADESLQLSNPDASSTESITNPTLPANAVTVVSQCSDEERAMPEKWWQCIQELREAGQLAAAESELANFHKAFPQYMPAK